MNIFVSESDHRYFDAIREMNDDSIALLFGTVHMKAMFKGAIIATAVYTAYDISRMLIKHYKEAKDLHDEKSKEIEEIMKNIKD